MMQIRRRAVNLVCMKALFLAVMLASCARQADAPAKAGCSDVDRARISAEYQSTLDGCKNPDAGVVKRCFDDAKKKYETDRAEWFKKQEELGCQ